MSREGRDSIRALLVDQAAQIAANQRDILAADHKVYLARQQLRDAEEHSDALRARDAGLKSMRKNLSDQLTRLVYEAYPDDILNEIFHVLICRWDSPDIFTANYDEMSFDRVRAQAPFHLACVSRRWRAICLANPAIWTYIGCNSSMGPGTAAAWTEYFKIVLKRSGSLGLTVVIESVMIPGLPISRVQHILDHWERWKLGMIGLNHDEHAALCETVFLRPAPLLQKLFVIGPPTPDTRTTPMNAHVLPVVPELRGLRCFSSKHALFRPPHAPVPSLTELHVDRVAITPSELHSMAQVCANLQSLRLDSEFVPADAAPPATPAVLAALTSLHLSCPDGLEPDSLDAIGRVGAFVDLFGSVIVTPNVRIFSTWDMEAIPAFPGLADQLEHLTLERSCQINSDSVGDMIILESLVHLRTLSLMKTQCNDNVFEFLISSRPFVLPSMVELSFGNEAVVIPSGGAALYSFVAARRQAAGLAEMNGKLQAIERVNLGSEMEEVWGVQFAALLRQ